MGEAFAVRDAYVPVEKNSKGGRRMQKRTISDLIASFDEQSDRVKSCLTDLLDIVKDGCVPSPESMSSLDG